MDAPDPSVGRPPRRPALSQGHYGAGGLLATNPEEFHEYITSLIPNETENRKSRMTSFSNLSEEPVFAVKPMQALLAAYATALH